MPSSLAAQLSQIAAKSTHQLDLKAQKAAHSQSLIFEKTVAGSQTFDTIYQICYEGFLEICALDPRFKKFQRTLFSEQSKSEDRLQMTAEQNAELNIVLENFLGLVGSKLLLTPAVKAVDWLIRRFRVHEYNSSFLILTFLPYHTAPIFLNLMSIIPEKNLAPVFKVLDPYHRGLINPPRHPLVHSATTNRHFFAALNNYVLQVARAQHAYSGLLTFWASVVTEAVAGMLDTARSGRSEVERRNQEDILVRILPILTEGFTLNHTSDLVVGCYMICIVLAEKGNLSDVALDSLIEAVVVSFTPDILSAGLTCVSMLVQRKSEAIFAEKILNALVKIEDFKGVLESIKDTRAVDALVNAIIYSGIGYINNGSKQQAVLDLISDVLKKECLTDIGISRAMTHIAKGAENLCKNGNADVDVRSKYAQLVRDITEDERLRTAFSNAVSTSGVDVESLEFGLSTMIENVPAQPQDDDVEMEDADDVKEEDRLFDEALNSLRKEKSHDTTFMSPTSNSLFKRLAVVFEQVGLDKHRLSKFVQLPVLGSKAVATKPLFLSFFTRFFSSAYVPSARAAAVSVVSSALSDMTGEKATELQALLPYIIAALSDTSNIVRREAASLLVNFTELTSRTKQDSSDDTSANWSTDFLPKSSWKPTFLSSNDLHKVTQRGLLSAVEEYSLDARHIAKVIEGVIRGKKGTADSAGELRKPTRQAFLTFLCSHIIASPLFSAKLRLLSITHRVNKVGSTSRTQELMPLLRQWRLMSLEEVDRIVSDEKLDLSDLDKQVVSIVSMKNTDAVDTLLSTVTSQSDALRPEFIAAVFHRISESWESTRERETQVADVLLQLALGTQKEHFVLSGPARDVLSSVPLSGPVLSHFLSTVSSTVGDVGSDGPSTKRRRMSQTNIFATSLKNSSEMRSLLEKLTITLELVDGSAPDQHPELLGGLFKALGCLHHLKLQMQSEMSYLLSLILGTMLSIVNKLKATPNAKFDASIIRADLVIDCVRTSESPQVQNTALLLVAGLSSLAPELILHSVMPIFTFMGSSVLRKDDEYSALVIDQTIDQVVPPLIQSLRNQKKDIVSGTSELLLSFTAAFEHIPSHRRLRLFEALVAKLGPEDFLFAVFSMLANKYPQDRDVLSVITSLASDFDAELQLLTYSKYIGLTHDALQPKPSLSRTLLGIGGDEGEDPADVSVNLLMALNHLIKNALTSKISEVFEATDSSADRANDLYSRILEQTLALTASTYQLPAVSQAVSGTLDAILGTLTLVDLVDTIEVLLQRKDNDLKRRILRLLENRITGNEKDVATHTRVTDFLDTLVEILKISTDIPLKQASVACITKIIDKYGKKNSDKVVSSVKVIAGTECLGGLDARLTIMAVLCLASSVEVLGQAFIPVLPLAMGSCFDLLRTSIQKGEKASELHDSIYSLFSSLLVHVPWMISEEYLDNLLLLSFQSASTVWPASSNDARLDTLQLLAKKIDVPETFRAAQANWPASVQAGFNSAKELLQVVSIAIEKHPKSATVRNVAILTKILQNGFDIRRTEHESKKFDADEINELEKLISEVALKMVYKLNDTIFRPVFVQLTEWATSGLPKADTAARFLRLTTFFKFVATFLGTLKSIVTSYSTYVLETVVDVLNNVRCQDQSTGDLWQASMTLLRNAFENDQDEYWQSPARLSDVAEPLINQLAQSTNNVSFKLISAEAIPTIVELATAAGSPDNHKEINTFIMKFMRARGADNPFTRLAAVKCEQALTERLGEEWLALLPEMLPYISELMEDDDESVEKEVRKWVLEIEDILGEKLDDMLM
ncbi:snoRNA-binding rRNA-processing protein utp10 [Ascosphaera aggregata]|nr:snoRNA-binding rRNA-processing protein utp10 [Ascosphaera aggregata]